MLDTVERPSECSDCTRYQKQIDRLKKAFLEADVESVRRCMQYEDKIFLEYEAEIEQLKAGHRSGSQSKKKMLEEVEGPVSNITYRHLR